MGDKRMLIVPAELVQKIDNNRGDMSQAEFIDFLINSQLQETKEKAKEQQYVTKEEMRVFEQDIKSLLKHSPKTEFEELTSRLHELENDLASEGEKREAKIKWK